MYVNGKMRPVEAIPEVEGIQEWKKGEPWRG
jgi:hypothetical protein